MVAANLKYETRGILIVHEKASSKTWIALYESDQELIRTYHFTTTNTLPLQHASRATIHYDVLFRSQSQVKRFWPCCMYCIVPILPYETTFKYYITVNKGLQKILPQSIALSTKCTKWWKRYLSSIKTRTLWHRYRLLTFVPY